MKYPFGKLLLTTLFLTRLTTTSFAQIDGGIVPSKELLQLDIICMGYADKHNWDSALFYSFKLQAKSDSEYGRVSEHGALCLYLTGEIYRLNENYKQALPYAMQSVDIYQKIYPHIGDFSSYYNALERVAFCYHSIGATQEAIHWYTKAIHLNDSLHKPSLSVESYQLLATLYVNKGDYTKADSLYAIQKSILDTSTHNMPFVHYQYAALFANTATIYEEIGDSRKSIQYLKKALVYERLAKKESYDDANNDYVAVCLNIAEVYSENNQMDSAWRFYKEAEDSNANRKDTYLKSLLVQEKATLYQRQNNFAKALTLFKNYIGMADSIRNAIDNYNATLVNLGICYSKTKRYSIADSLYRDIIFGLRQSGEQYSYTMLQAKKELCSNLITEKKFAIAMDSLLSLVQVDLDAIHKNSASMSEADKLQYVEEADKVFNLLYVCIRFNPSVTGRTIKAIYKAELKRKAWVLRNQLVELNAIKNAKDSAATSLYREWQMNKEILSKQYSLPYKQRLFKADSLEEIVEQTEKKMASVNMAIVRDDNALPSSLQPAASTANIAFVRYDDKMLYSEKGNAWYAAFITTATDTIPHFVVLCNEKEIVELLKDNKGKWINENQLTQKLYDKNSPFSTKLYNCIWRKLSPYLVNIKNINYSTASLLNNISFPAVCDGNNYLINRFTFNRFFSLQESFANSNTSAKPQQVSVWGNINYQSANYDNAFAEVKLKDKSACSSSLYTSFVSTNKGVSNKPLASFNTEEISRIKKIFSDYNIIVQCTENGKATEDIFKQKASSLHGIVHISTHGFYVPFNNNKAKSSLPSGYISSNTNPLFRCGLAFAGVNKYWLTGKTISNHEDGILTGYEVSQLDLQNVDLVTLSACETGLGDVTNNEGDLGLQRAFKMAGVHNMLVSLWQVPAQQTSQLLSLFYTSLLKGNSYSEALRMAELTLQKQYPPYYWAGFVLIQ